MITLLKKWAISSPELILSLTAWSKLTTISLVQRTTQTCSPTWWSNSTGENVLWPSITTQPQTTREEEEQRTPWVVDSFKYPQLFMFLIKIKKNKLYIVYQWHNYSHVYNSLYFLMNSNESRFLQSIRYFGFFRRIADKNYLNSFDGSLPLGNCTSWVIYIKRYLQF